MGIPDQDEVSGYRAFKLERYFGQHEFVAPYPLCSSECEPFALSELLAMADADSRSRWDSLSLAYTDSAGLPALRQEICKLYDSMAPINCQIAAPEEAIFLAMKALLSAGDHVICTYPGYQSLFENAKALSCKVSFWRPATSSDGAITFANEDLNALFQANTKLVVVNFPHNPSGFLPSQSAWQDFNKTCAQRGVAVFSDEMYRFTEHSSGLTLPSAADLNPRAVALGGVSKGLALPGLRIGWLMSQDTALLQRVQHLKDFTTICASAPSEVLALIGLRQQKQILERNMAIIKSNLDLLDAFFDRRRDMFEWHRPSAGTIGLVRLKTSESVDSFCERCIKEAGVLLAPDSMFDPDCTAGSNSFRVGFGKANMPRGLQQLDAYLSRTACDSPVHRT